MSAATALRGSSGGGVTRRARASRFGARGFDARSGSPLGGRWAGRRSRGGRALGLKLERTMLDSRGVFGSRRGWEEDARVQVALTRSSQRGLRELEGTSDPEGERGMSRGWVVARSEAHQASWTRPMGSSDLGGVEGERRERKAVGSGRPWVRTRRRSMPSGGDSVGSWPREPSGSRRGASSRRAELFEKASLEGSEARAGRSDRRRDGQRSRGQGAEDTPLDAIFESLAIWGRRRVGNVESV